MSPKRKPYVIAIAAVAGGGKTTITKRLNKLISNSTAIYFDDYDFEESPDDICKWIENGGDPNEWVLTPLIEDLRLLLSKNSYNYIFLDFPFAYQHKKMSSMIDYTIFINTPLDIAMARRIQRDFNKYDDVKNEMGNYLNRGRKAYLHMLETIRPDSDYIVDGKLSIESITDLIIEKIDNNRKEVN
jgi:uridine kinase